jgi:hypothetical protein
MEMEDNDIIDAGTIFCYALPSYSHVPHLITLSPGAVLQQTGGSF